MLFDNERGRERERERERERWKTQLRVSDVCVRERKREIVYERLCDRAGGKYRFKV
jgi:hypothetical protein